MLWIDYFWERDTTPYKRRKTTYSCGLITLGNEIQQTREPQATKDSCGLITLGNEIQRHFEFISTDSVVD